MRIELDVIKQISVQTPTQPHIKSDSTLKLTDPNTNEILHQIDLNDQTALNSGLLTQLGIKIMSDRGVLAINCESNLNLELSGKLPAPNLVIYSGGKVSLQPGANAAAATLIKAASVEFSEKISTKNLFLDCPNVTASTIAVSKDASAEIINAKSCKFNSLSLQGSLQLKASGVECDRLFLSGDKAVNIDRCFLKVKQSIAGPGQTQFNLSNSLVVADSATLNGTAQVAGSCIIANTLALSQKADITASKLYLKSDLLLDENCNARFESSEIETPSYYGNGKCNFTKTTVNTGFYQQNAPAEYSDSTITATDIIDVNQQHKAVRTKFNTQGQFVASHDVALEESEVTANMFVQNRGNLQTSNSTVNSAKNFILKQGATASITDSKINTELLSISGATTVTQSEVHSELVQVFAALGLNDSKSSDTKNFFVSALAQVNLSKSNLKAEQLAVHGAVTATENSSLKTNDLSVEAMGMINLQKSATATTQNSTINGLIEVDNAQLTSEQSTTIAGELNLQKANAALGALEVAHGGTVVALEQSEVNTKSSNVSGGLVLDESSISTQEKLSTNTTGHITLSDSRVAAKTGIEQHGNLQSYRSALKTEGDFKTKNTANISGSSVVITADSATMAATTELTDSMRLNAKTARIKKPVKARKVTFDVAGKLKINAAVSAAETKIDSDNLILGVGGSIKGDNLTAKTLATTLLPGSNLNVTNVSMQAMAYNNIGGAVFAFDSHITSMVGLDMGLNLPTIPTDPSQLLNAGKLWSVGRTLLSNFSRPAATLLSIGEKSYGMYNQIYQQPNDNPEIDQNSFEYLTNSGSIYESQSYRRYISPLLQAKSVATSMYSLYGEVGSLHQHGSNFKTAYDAGRSMDAMRFDRNSLWSSAGNFARDAASIFAPSVTREIGLNANAGFTASYTVNDQNAFSVNAGYTGANTARMQTAFDQYNYGTYQANTLNLESRRHFNYGTETARDRLMINAREVMNDGTINFGNVANIEADHIASSETSAINGAPRSHLDVISTTEDLRGGINGGSATLDVDDLSASRTRDLISGTHSGANITVSDGINVITRSTERVVLDEYARAPSVAIGLATSGDVVHQAEFNGRALVLETNGQLDLNADANAAENLRFRSGADLNNHGNQLRATAGDAVLISNGTINNVDGTVEAMQGTALVQGATVNNTAQNSAAGARIAGNVALVAGTVEDVNNHGSVIEGSTFASVTAARDVNITARNVAARLGDQNYTEYQEARISGGTGSADTNGVGVYVHADRNVQMTASTVDATGDVAIDADEEIAIATVHNTRHYDYRLDDKNGETYHRGDTTVLGVSSVSGNHISYTSKGNIGLHGVQSEARNGVSAVAKKNIKFTSHVVKEHHYVKRVRHKLYSKSNDTWTESEKLNVIATNSGNIHAHAQEGRIDALGNLFLGGPDAKLSLKAKEHISLQNRKLQHKTTTKSKGFKVNIAGHNIGKHANQSNRDRLNALNPVNSINKLGKINNPLELANVANALDDSTKLLNNVATNGLGNTLLAGVDASITFTQTESTATSETRGGGGIAGFSETTFSTDGTVEIGSDVQTRNMEVEAARLLLQNQQLNYSNNSTQVSLTTSVNAQGTVGGGAQMAQQNSHGFTNTQGSLQTDSLSLKVKEAEINGFVVKTNELHLDNVEKITTRDTLNSHHAVSVSAAADSKGNVSASKTKEHSETCDAVGAIYADRVTDNSSVKEFHNVGSLGVKIADQASAKKMNAAAKHTQQDLQERHKVSGLNFSSNAKQLESASKNGVNATVGINRKDYKATIGLAGKTVTKDAKLNVDLRAHLPAELFQAKPASPKYALPTDTQQEQSQAITEDADNSTAEPKKAEPKKSQKTKLPAAKNNSAGKKKPVANKKSTTNKKSVDHKKPAAEPAQPGDDWEQETEFYDRKVNGVVEAKIAAGVVVGFFEGVVESAVNPFILASRALAQAERLDACYPDKITDETEALCAEYHKSNAEFRTAAAELFDDAIAAAKRPDQAIVKQMVIKGEQFMKIVDKSKTEPFNAGRDMGKEVHGANEFSHEFIHSMAKLPAGSMTSKVSSSGQDIIERIDHRVEQNADRVEHNRAKVTFNHQ